MRQNNQRDNGLLVKKVLSLGRKRSKLSTVFDIETLENATEVRLDSRQAQKEFVGNCIVRVTISHQLDDFSVLVAQFMRFVTAGQRQSLFKQ
jgi:hypothetical protein